MKIATIKSLTSKDSQHVSEGVKPVDDDYNFFFD
jgi:hypothetical protein